VNIGIIASAKLNISLDPNAMARVGTGEYAITWGKNDGTLYTVTGNEYNGLGYNVVQIPGLSNIVQVDGGQYNTLARSATGQAYTIPGNSTTVTHYPSDNLGNPFTCDHIQGFYATALALKNGELWYWNINNVGGRDGAKDILNQGYLGTVPKKLIQPPNKTLTKIVSASSTSFGSLTYVWALASDGTVWRWDQTHTTPFQVTGGWAANSVIDVALVGPNAYVVVTNTNQICAWGYLGNYVGAQPLWQNTNPQNITSLWTNAGLDFPIKKIVGTYNTLHIIDANNDLFASGSNVQGNIGNGVQTASWKTNVEPYAWSFENGLLVQGPLQVPGKWKNIVSNNTVVFYLYGQDMNNNWYSWGRNKAEVLGNGITTNSSNAAIYPEYYNIPAPRLVTPLTQTWSILPVDINANRAPIANAGINQYLTDVTSTTLYGSGSHQQQPTASLTVTMAYAWTKTSGPTCTITSPTAQNTTVTGMTPGTYVFRLTVTNSNNLTDFIEVTVIVSSNSITPVPNIAPTANAGADKSITLPTSTTTLNGSGSDSDGTIASYSWSKLSGPSGGTISSPTSATTNITALQEGTYVFRLTVTDNLGLTGTDTASVVVAPAPPPAGQFLTTVNGWNAYVHLPDDYNSNPSTYYPTIIFIPGFGEVGPNAPASRAIVNGPGAYITQGWNGNVTVSGTTVKFIVISLQPSSSYPGAVATNTRISTLKSTYRIDTTKMHLTGLSHGAWVASIFVTSDALGGPFTYAGQVASVVNVQGVTPTSNQPYPDLFDNFADVGGRYLGFEQTQDPRDIRTITDRMNARVPNSGIFVSTSFGNGDHCCWNQFYGGQGTQPTRFTLDGISQNIYEWMARESL
jgi:hypothetical protein